MKIRTVLIDDEAKVRQSIVHLLHLHCPQVELVGEGASVVAGKQSFKGFVVLESIDRLPLVYIRILNQNGTFQVGNEVVPYKNGKEYIVSSAEYTKIQEAGTSLESLPNILTHETKMTSLTEGDSQEIENPNDTTTSYRSRYGNALYFHYGGLSRRFIREVTSFANRYVMVVQVENKLEYYRRRLFWINTWERDRTNSYKEMGTFSLSFTGNLSPFGSGGGSVRFGRPQTTRGNNSLVTSYSFPVDALYGVTLTGSMYSELGTHRLNNRNLNRRIAALTK
jgi:hypothetical protein